MSDDSDTLTVKDVEIEIDFAGDGVIVSHDGQNRSILVEELREMCEDDNPYTIQ